MALLPTCNSLQCPSLSRGLTLRQVGASGKFCGRPSVLLAWRRRCQRVGTMRVQAMGGRKKQVGRSGENNERPELKFEANDLMELEFGRLLGEPRQATLAKVLGRKVNPEASYVDIEKRPMKEFKEFKSSPSQLSEAEFARLLNEEGRPDAKPLEGVYKPQKAASQDENLPGLVKPPARPGMPLPQVPRRPPSVNSPTKTANSKKAVPLVTFGPGGFAAQSNKARAAEEDDHMNLVQKPTIGSPDSYKPSWPKIDSVPPMLMRKSKKAEAEEDDDYMDLVQKPAIPSPDSIKPSWPKNESVPPMLIGKSKKPVESVDDSLLRKPMPADTTGSSGVSDSDIESRIDKSPKPSQPKRSQKVSASPIPVAPPSPSSADNSEEQFAKLLELAESSAVDQDMPSETSTSSSLNNRSRSKKTPKLGVKPVLAAKPPPPVDESREVASADTSVSTSSIDPPMAPLPPVSEDVEVVRSEENAEPTVSDAEADVGLDETPAMDVAKEDDQRSDPEQSILRLVKKASRIAPVRPPKRFPQAIPEAVKAKITDAGASEDDRLAGWSEEVKAAVKRSEAALPSLTTPTPSEAEFDQLLQRRKAELQLRPVPPRMPESSPEPAEASIQQRSFTRAVVPKPPRDPPTNVSQQEAGVLPSDRAVPSKEEEDQDWARAEALRESKTVEEVVFTRAISNGMLANFGSLVGFLAAYELSSSRRPPSFSTWAQENGFKINRKLKSSVASESDVPAEDSEGINGTERTGGADEEYKRVLNIYTNYRAELLAALVGQTAKVVVTAVERERKQLRFSEKEAEGEGQELAQKRAQLMTSLDVGDVVKCTVKKVTNFGAFVELQGVPALIHISELSWNRVTDPSTILNVGQEVEVKVCRLDRYLQRISLSLKQMQPDPLRETLESLELRGTAIDDEDVEITTMPELIGMTKRLGAYKGIDSVQIGRRLQGNALAPTFQVYLSDQLDDGFKLLARSGNLVQEVLVQTALDRESMKDAIRQCTFSDN